jgi:hypothetical protein
VNDLTGASSIIQFLVARYAEERARQQRIYQGTYEYGARCPTCQRPTSGMTNFYGDPSRVARFKPCGHETNDPDVFQEPAPDLAVLADLDAKEKILNAYAKWQRRADAGEELSEFERGALAQLYSVCRMLAEAEGWKP